LTFKFDIRSVVSSKPFQVDTAKKYADEL